MKENEWRIDHLIFGFSIGAIASYMLLSSSFVSSESVYMLIIFNFLFVSLTFPLDGTLTRKISMLLIGNIIGLFWNYLFSLFAYTVAYYLGEFFNTLYIILSPLVNLIWIVSFWSISLTALANSKDKKLGLRFDN
ncbi:MAG: hypothetical protein WAN82_01530 [Candidatus Bathyarchaeia archaeon]|jgi:hypothetical protein